MSIKKIFVISMVILVASIAATAQFPLIGFDHVRKVKFLEADRISVRQTLLGFTLDDAGDEDSDDQSFSNSQMSVEIEYSTGGCDEEDDSQIWNVAKGKAIWIEITPEETLTLDEAKLDLSKYQKEQIYFENTDRFIYHDKVSGIAFQVSHDEVTRIFLFPSQSSKVGRCKTDEAKRLASKNWFGDSKLEDRKIISCAFASVTAVELSDASLQFSSPNKEIAVDVTASDPENDPLTYVYVVSGGKIIGTGSKVVWSLKGLPSGSYKITAGVDDGCGLCGATVTKTVIIG